MTKRTPSDPSLVYEGYKIRQSEYGKLWVIEWWYCNRAEGYCEVDISLFEWHWLAWLFARLGDRKKHGSAFPY